MLACVEKRGEYGQSKKTLNELEIPYFQNWKNAPLRHGQLGANVAITAEVVNKKDAVR